MYEHLLSIQEECTSHLLLSVYTEPFNEPSQLKASIEGSDPTTHQNIYDLSMTLIKNTKCTMSVPLCAQVALMVSLHTRLLSCDKFLTYHTRQRAVYKNHPGNDFWDRLDDKLIELRNKARGNERKWAK